MLEIINSVRRMDFRQLIQVYEESLKKEGMERYPDLDVNRQLLEAEQDFYRFLTDFLHMSGALYALWTVDGIYRAALRIEPYKDGVLITGLETAPDCRRRAYASSLIEAVLRYVSQNGINKVYSHISNQNIASVMTHQKCGFRKISDCAVFLDGSVNRKSSTYLVEI